MSSDHKKVNAGFGIMVLKDNKVLIGKRHDDPNKASSALHGEGTWTFPGGKLHFGESFEEGAKRELLEETGITANKFEVISLSNEMVPDTHFVTVGLLCADFSGSPQVLEPDEITKWQWFSFDDLPSPLYKPTEKFIKNYEENKFYKY